jgi:hypothetical protein
MRMHVLRTTKFVMPLKKVRTMMQDWVIQPAWLPIFIHTSIRIQVQIAVVLYSNNIYYIQYTLPLNMSSEAEF